MLEVLDVVPVLGLLLFGARDALIKRLYRPVRIAPARELFLIREAVPLGLHRSVGGVHRDGSLCECGGSHLLVLHRLGERLERAVAFL